MFLGPLLFTGLIVLAVYLLVGPGKFNIGSTPPPREPAPLEILDQRLARGDIDRREYDEKRRLLEHG